MQRPTSSKTRLLIRQHSFPRRSKSFTDSPSHERASQDSGFDSWDTSEVAPYIRETVLQSSPKIRGKPLSPLEPIPGSRSPSPAKALEGPFFPQPESLSPPPSVLGHNAHGCAFGGSAHQWPRAEAHEIRQPPFQPESARTLEQFRPIWSPGICRLTGSGSPSFNAGIGAPWCLSGQSDCSASANIQASRTSFG